MNSGRCSIHDDRDAAGKCSCSEIVADLRAALDAALQLRIGDERLITVMRRRYGREAHQWCANHDQRKAERDVALERVQKLEKWFARYSIHGSPMLAVVAERDDFRASAARLTKENAALSKVYGVAVGLRQFPVPFNDHFELVGAVDECRQALHDLAFREPKANPDAEHWTVPFLTDRQRYALRCLRDFARPRLATAAPDDRNRCDPGLAWLNDLLDKREAKEPPAALNCPHCQAGEPSVWDDALDHFAHPAPPASGDKLKFCLDPWRARCRRCSADPAYKGAKFCGAACSQLAEMKGA